jgi:hypothetical protein
MLFVFIQSKIHTPVSASRQKKAPDFISRSSTTPADFRQQKDEATQHKKHNGRIATRM